ncbi:34143_t:CDS:1, partial [Racocetra persica]
MIIKEVTIKEVQDTIEALQSLQIPAQEVSSRTEGISINDQELVVAKNKINAGITVIGRLGLVDN